jgi:hypothetical protein
MKRAGQQPFNADKMGTAEETACAVPKLVHDI